MFCSNASVEPDVTMFTQACSELGTVVACLYITPEWLPHTHFTRNANVQPHCIISFYPERMGSIKHLQRVSVCCDSSNDCVLWLSYGKVAVAECQGFVHEIFDMSYALSCLIKMQTGSWCSGITSASHAEGPGFKSKCVHFERVVLFNFFVPSRCLCLKCKV